MTGVGRGDIRVDYLFARKSREYARESSPYRYEVESTKSKQLQINRDVVVQWSQQVPLANFEKEKKIIKRIIIAAGWVNTTSCSRMPGPESVELLCTRAVNLHE